MAQKISGGVGESPAAGIRGSPLAWIVSTAMIAAFLLAGAALTQQLYWLVGVGAGLFLTLGAVGLATHVWGGDRDR
jgi:hypothetical protein